ncbi:MAG: RHS repeat-associated core domain-containing protein, partial [Clostridiales bacterium]
MYAQARYYLPEIGRFISEDNYKGIQYEPRTLNYYIYCLNNPINLIDPSGFCSEYDLFEFNPSFSKSYVVSGVKVGCDSYEAWYIIEKCKYLSREERIRINEKGTNSVKWTKLNPKNNPLYAKGAYSSTSKIIKNSKKAGLSGFTKGNVAFSAIGIGIDTYSNISDLKEQGADSET